MVQYLILEHEREGKLASKTRWGMHLGMSMESKGWHVVDIESKRMVITRDPRFYEDMSLEQWQKWRARVGDGNDQPTPPFASVPSLFPEPHNPQQNPPPPRTIIVVAVPSVQGGKQSLDRSVGPLGRKAPTAPPPLSPHSVADSAPVGPEDGPLEVGTSMADHEEEEVAVDEQSPMAHEHEPSPADADDEDNPYDVAYLAEDNCDTDSEDKVEYPDEDEEEEDDWGGVILDLAAALTGPEGKEWWAAMKEEMESLDEQGTWTLADLPEGRNSRHQVPIEEEDAAKWHRGEVQGQTLAMDLDLLQLDVKNAFLHSTINHEIYMQQSPYFTDGRSNVCLLQKSLYGLKQTPLQWYKELDKGAGPFMGADGRLVGLKRVLLVPGLCANLLSTKALSEAGMQKEMMGTKVFKATLDGRVLWDLRGGKDMHRSMWEIPVLPWKEAAARLAAEAIRGGHASHVTSGGAGDGSNGGLLVHGGGALPSVTPSTGETDWLTAHRRFGHVALPQLQQLFKEERVKGLRIKGEPKEVSSCETCLTSKFSQFPFHSTVGQSSDPVELVHVDLVGPMKVKGDGGALYTMTMVDDYTRLTWSFPLAKKSDAARVIIEEWLPMVERESGKRVKAIRSDRGGEFLGAEFRSWLKRHGIKKQLTTAYTPQSNGVAERANRTIIEDGRTILVDSGLPLRFWPLAIRHATVIKNRVLTHVGGQHWVPMEKWSGNKPLVDMLRVFGCMELVHVPKEKRNKLQAAAVWAVHLGLAWGSKGWLMWDKTSNTIFTTRDAKFMEGLMFKEWSERGRSKVTIPLGIEVGTNDPLLIPNELSSSSELTEVSHDLGGAEGEAADVEEVLQQGEAPIAKRGDTEEEVQQPTPSPKLPPRRTTQGKRDAVRGGAKEGAAKERPKRDAHRRDFLKYGRLGVPKALLVQEEEYEEEKGAEGEMEHICCFGVNLPHEPASMEEALAGDDREAWLASREDEFQSHMENETWTLTNLPPGRKALDCTTSGMGLVLGGRSPVVLTGHADASWADDQATQRSSQGYTFSLGSGSVSWRATRSSSVLGSSCEAEIYAGAMAAQELRWLTYLLTDLGEPPRSPPVLYVNNKAMLALCREQRLEHRTKHIALRYFLARELQQRGQLRLAYVASEANTADVFAKALAPCDHQRFCTQLGLVPVLPHLLTS
ncbi:unnamed protein product [Closterium sp. NIES-54]